MVKLSRIKLEPNKLGFFINNFWSLITLLENKDEVKNFLRALLTHTEMKMFAKRIQIAKMLIEGYKYQDIKNYTKVTNSTISRISNILENEGDGLKSAIGYLQKMEKERERELMQATPDVKKKYSIYFLPEKLLNQASKNIKKKSKKDSAKSIL